MLELVGLPGSVRRTPTRHRQRRLIWAAALLCACTLDFERYEFAGPDATVNARSDPAGAGPGPHSVRVWQAAGGTTMASASHTLRVTVSAPHPLGNARSANYRILVAPMSHADLQPGAQIEP
jgi:hypothetical protein